MSSYCTKCGDSGEIFETGERCDCSIGQGTFESVKGNCLMIPEQYRGAGFKPDLLPVDLSDYYVRYMGELYTGIVNQTLRNVNIFLSTPVKHGKTVLAYSCLEQLYYKGIMVFPLYDVLELKRMIQEADYGKKNAELEEQGLSITDLYTVPYLFLKITSDLSFSVFDTLKLLLDRRLRRSGGVTVILSDLGYDYVAAADQRGSFKHMIGDGSFGTIINKTFWLPGGDKGAV